MKEITVNTTVGELIPGGKYCNVKGLPCPFSAYYSALGWVCEVVRYGDKYGSINGCDLKTQSYKVIKHPACPKPPCEVKNDEMS